MSAFKYDVFLSFSSVDLQKAKEVYRILSEMGIKVFLAEEVMRANEGRSFHDVIESALKKSEHFIIYLSNDAFNSGWVKVEYETFFNEYFVKEKGRRMFLLNQNDVEVEIPFLLRRNQISKTPEDIGKIILDEKSHRSGKSAPESFSLKAEPGNFIPPSKPKPDQPETTKNPDSTSKLKKIVLFIILVVLSYFLLQESGILEAGADIPKKGVRTNTNGSIKATDNPVARKPNRTPKGTR